MNLLKISYQIHSNNVEFEQSSLVVKAIYYTVISALMI